MDKTSNMVSARCVVRQNPVMRYASYGMPRLSCWHWIIVFRIQTQVIITVDKLIGNVHQNIAQRHL